MSDVRKKIKCEKCNKTIATGKLPAPIDIKCEGCGHVNKLDNRSFTERLMSGLEKK